MKKKEKILRATHGSPNKPLKIGKIEIPCYVLEDGTRILTQYGFYKAIGRSGKPAKGRGSSFENIAPFLALNNLKPFINKKLIDSTKPIKFKPPKGASAWGYRAEILPMVCEVYLKARDDNKLLKAQQKFAVACDIILRGLAHVGIIALVDEITGYQEKRDKEELRKILEAYIAKELLPWTKMFPDEFYKQMFRLRGWQYSPLNVKRPQVVGKLTNKIVYEKLPPGVLKELKGKNPVIKKGDSRYRKHKFFQFLTEDIGHPHLQSHLAIVITLMKISPNWRSFERFFERAFFKSEQLELELSEEDYSIEEIK